MQISRYTRYGCALGLSCLIRVTENTGRGQDNFVDQIEILTWSRNSEDCFKKKYQKSSYAVSNFIHHGEMIAVAFNSIKNK